MAKKSKPFIKRPLTPDAMGRAGQTKFGELCDLGNLIANDSSRADRMGWDYLVEVPFDASRGDEAFDKRQKVPDMKVQVKTIWADNHSVDLELIAAERLARWEYPSFIVILRMNLDKTYRDAYVIHLLDNNLARILKALREAEAKNARSIKDRTLTFNISSGTAVAIDGDELRKALRDALGNDGISYAARKRDQLQNLGFGVNRVSGRFELAANDSEEVLNIFLGIQEGQVSRFDVDEVRFDISTPLSRDESGQIEIKPESKGPCDIVISSPREHKRVVFDAELYFASLGGPSAPWKMRVISNLVELLVSKNASDASFRVGISEDGRYTLDEWVSVRQANLIMASGPSIAIIRKQGKTLLSFTVEQQSIFGAPEHLKENFHLLLALRDLMGELRIRDLRLSDNDLFENFHGIKFIFDSQRHGNGITIKTTIKQLDKELIRLDVIEGMYASKVEFAGATIAFWAHMHLDARSENELIHLTCSDLVLRDIALVESDEDFIAWVKEASESTGLDIVLRLDKVVFDNLQVFPSLEPEA